jgi:hypothetical protein
VRRNAAALLVLGQSLDALTFVLFFTIVPVGFAMVERNGIVGRMLDLGGLGLVAAVKVGLAAVIYWRATRPFGQRRLPERLHLLLLAFLNVAFVVAVASGFVGTAFNSRAVMQVLTGG